MTGLDVAALCFEENDKLNITEYTQICMLTTEAAIYTALQAAGIGCDVTAGLSLGEYGALIASGAMTMRDAFAVVRKRGIYMEQAYPVGGGMSAILGLDAEKIAAICEETAAKTNKVVSIANYNCPGQIVITGAADAVGMRHGLISGMMTQLGQSNQIQWCSTCKVVYIGIIITNT